MLLSLCEVANGQVEAASGLVWSGLVWTILAPGCEENDKGDDTGELGGSEVLPNDACTADDGQLVPCVYYEEFTCSEAPEPRRFHQQASFIHSPTLAYDDGSADRLTERGFVVQGGVSATGGALSDTWLFDLSREGCPWVELPGSGVSVAEGGMFFDDVTESFYLVAGRTSSGSGNWRSTLDVYAMSGLSGDWELQLAGDGSPVFDAPPIASTVHTSAPSCFDFDYVTCFCDDPNGCSGTAYLEDITLWRRPGVSTSLTITDLEAYWAAACEDDVVPMLDWECQVFNLMDGDCDECNGEQFGVLAGCLTDANNLLGDDPICRVPSTVGYGDTTRLETVTISQDGQSINVLAGKADHELPGLHGFIGTWDPGARIYTIDGGASGCLGSSCGAFGELRDESDFGDRKTLELANSGSRIAVHFPHSGQGVLSTTLEVFREVDRLSWAPRPGLHQDASVGLRNAAAAQLGMGWDPSTHEFAVDEARSSVAVYGGSWHQSLVPFAVRTDPADEFGNAAGQWDSWWHDGLTSTPQHGTAWERSENVYLTRATDAPSYTDTELTTEPAVLDAAMAPTGTGFVMLGGQDAGGPVASLTVWNVDEVGDAPVLATTNASGGGNPARYTDVPPTYGARGSRDPLSGHVRFFGDFSNDGKVLTVDMGGSRPCNGPVEVEVRDLSVDVAYLGPTEPTVADMLGSPWKVEVALDVRGVSNLSVAGLEKPCLANEVILPIDGAWKPSNSNSALTAHLRRPHRQYVGDDQPWFDVAAEHSWGIGNGIADTVPLIVTLPAAMRALPADEQHGDIWERLHLTWEVEGKTQGLEVSPYPGEADNGLDWWRLAATLDDGTSPAAAVEPLPLGQVHPVPLRDTNDVGQIRYLVPEPYLVATVGTSTSCTDTEIEEPLVEGLRESCFLTSEVNGEGAHTGLQAYLVPASETGEAHLSTPVTGSIPGSGATWERTLRLFVADGSPPAVREWMTSTGPSSPEAIAAFVGDRVGFQRAADQLVVVVAPVMLLDVDGVPLPDADDADIHRFDSVNGATARSVGRISTVFPRLGKEARRPYPDALTATTTAMAHEMAHLELLSTGFTDTDDVATSFLEEGLPTLVGLEWLKPDYELYVAFAGMAELDRVLQFDLDLGMTKGELIAYFRDTCTGAPASPACRAETSIGYTFGALWLAQAALLDGDVSTEHLWASWNATYAAVGDAFDPVHLEAFAGALQADDYAETALADNTAPTPMLAIVGVEGLGTNTVDVLVEQVQARYGDDVLDGVPFVIGCTTLDGLPLSDDCIEGGGGVHSFEATELAPGGTEASVHRVSLVVQGDVATTDDGVNQRSSVAVEIGLAGPEQLVPGAEELVLPDYTSRTLTDSNSQLARFVASRMVWCESAATDSVCTTDQDGDGVPDDWDPIPNDNLVPGPDAFWLFDTVADAIADPALSSRCVDYNWDGVPIPGIDPSCGGAP